MDDLEWNNIIYILGQISKNTPVPIQQESEEHKNKRLKEKEEIDKKIVNRLISAFKSCGIEIRDDKGNYLLSFDDACGKLYDKWIIKE